MNDIGQELNRALKDQPPAHADPGLLEAAHSRIRRRRRIRAIGAAVAALGLVAVAAAVLLGTWGGSANHAMKPARLAGAVPWTNRIAPAYTPSQASAATAPAAKYPPCTAAALTGRLGAFGLGAGSYSRYLVLTNAGGSACTLSGGPSGTTGVRADGTRVRLAGASGERRDSNLIGPANLLPGQSAQVSLTTTYGCSAQSSCSRSGYTAVIVGVGGSGAVRVDFPRGQPFTVVNGIAVSTFGVPVESQAQISSPLDVLTVSIAMPATLTAGTTASYTVTLHNPTSRPVSLSPCPSYEEFMVGLGNSPASGLRRYYLNCGAVSQIPASGSVAFAIRIPAPTTAGQAKFGWALQGTSVEGGGAVSVVAR
jgi:hypothetical protein